MIEQVGRQALATVCLNRRAQVHTFGLFRQSWERRTTSLYLIAQTDKDKGTRPSTLGEKLLV